MITRGMKRDLTQSITAITGVIPGRSSRYIRESLSPESMHSQTDPGLFLAAQNSKDQETAETECDNKDPIPRIGAAVTNHRVYCQGSRKPGLCTPHECQL